MKKKTHRCIVLGLTAVLLLIVPGWLGAANTVWLALGLCRGASAASLFRRTRPGAAVTETERPAGGDDAVVLSKMPTACDSESGLEHSDLIAQGGRRPGRRCHVDRFYLALLRDL